MSAHDPRTLEERLEWIANWSEPDIDLADAGTAREALDRIKSQKARIQSLERQLEEAMGIMRDLADDLDAEVEARYQGMEKYPTMFRKAEADREPIRRARAFLQQKEPSE